jgi:hypothetical protein
MIRPKRSCASKNDPIPMRTNLQIDHEPHFYF